MPQRRYRKCPKKNLSSRLTQNGPTPSSLRLERWLVDILRGLSEAQCGDSERVIPLLKDVRGYRFPWRDRDLLNIRCQFRVLVNWDRRIQQSKDGVHESAWSLPVRVNAIRPGKRTGNIKMGDGCHTVITKWQLALVYLDDILVISKNASMHTAYLRQVLARLRDAGVPLKLKKYAFLAEKINNLRHFIRLRRLEISKPAATAVRKLKEPTTQTEVRSFLGLCNVSRRFVPNVSQAAAPLNKELQKDQLTTFPSLSKSKKDAV